MYRSLQVVVFHKIALKLSSLLWTVIIPEMNDACDPIMFDPMVCQYWQVSTRTVFHGPFEIKTFY